MELATHGPRPRFRNDLVAEVIDAEGQRFIDVIDPDTGDAFRFYEVEYSLACAMDGERDVVGLVQWAKEELGIEPSPQELETVISTLGGLGYLDASGAARADELELERGVVAPRAAAAPPIAADVELGIAGGTSAPDAPAMPRGVDVELGGAGGNPLARAAAPSDVELELGAPGAAGGTGSGFDAMPTVPVEPVPSLRARGATRPDADEDGPTHLPPAAPTDFDDEVSVDLSEHLSLRPDDVKEAVRMSRSMQAVQVPPELLDEVERKEAEAAERVEAARQAAEAATPAAEAATTATAPSADDVEAASRAARESRPAVWSEPVGPAPEPARPAVELPEKPVVVTREKPADRPAAVEKQPVAPTPTPAPDTGGGGTSKVLIFLFVLVLLGGGAFLVWKYVLDKPGDDAGDTTSGQVEPATKDPGAGTGATAGTGAAAGTGATAGTGAGTAATKPSGPPTATLEEVGAPPSEVKAAVAGVVATAVSEGADVQAGDVLIEYQAAAAIQRKLGTEARGLLYDVTTRYPREIEAAQKRLDAAKAKGDAAGARSAEAKIKERTARLDEQKQRADELQAELDQQRVTAPAAGKVMKIVGKGARVAADEPVATIDTGRSLVARFAGVERPVKINDSVRLVAKDDPAQVANCTVSAVESTSVTVTCPLDIGIAAGTAVVLEG